ncbi:hypothetical protein DFH09DRAFT_1078286, partial [Mycena vulgaris]
VFKDSTSPLYIRAASPIPPHPTSEASLQISVFHSPKVLSTWMNRAKEESPPSYIGKSYRCGAYVGRRPTSALPSTSPLVLRTVTVVPMVQSLSVLAGKLIIFKAISNSSSMSLDPLAPISSTVHLLQSVE